MTNILSHGLAAAAFSGLFLLLLVSRQPGRVGTSLLVACLFSILWSAVALLANHEVMPSTGLTETARILSWTFFLNTLMHSGKTMSEPMIDKSSSNFLASLIRSNVSLFILLLASIQIIYTLLAISPYTPPISLNLLLPAIWICASITGLACLEGVYRGTATEKRRALKPLFIGLIGMFILDFLVFTDTLLFRRINLDIWQARGFFYAFLVPVIAMTVARNPTWAVRIHVSRQAVTSSITVMCTGGYLLTTALAAYFIQLSGVEWANVAQIAFVLISLVVLVLALVSRRLRAKLKVNVSKHLFSFKYDYRKEWLNFTQILSTEIEDAPSAIVQGLTQIMHSESGSLWAKNTDNEWELVASKGPQKHYGIQSDRWDFLVAFMRRTGWIVQLSEYQKHPEKYEGLLLPEELIQSTDAWLIIPLPASDDIIGFVIINRSSVIQTITWEDRDLLKTAGQQAAGLLAQRRSQEALAQAQQFQAFSKLSAYVVHDLKNILGQQSLIVSNATKHKHKPAFVDDVITTVENSVSRMQSLLEKLREQQLDEDQAPVDLASTLTQASQLRPHIRPQPKISPIASAVRISASADKLIRVFGHLIHNAQDATDDVGHILISVESQKSSVIITITDNGAGMTDEFVKSSLFKPFVSSKGLTGMGIGVYESREYIRKLGGKIEVSSEVGKGTMFSITLPTIE